ncbi:MAG: hypothetical protein HQ582_00100 [Planctomycetes bacterium]|nr:hypothetical protein [Planctomycetota bacterium]
MPRRTNDFQELVSLVQKALVPSGAKVTDSALVDVPGMSEPREIDVLIETAVGPYHLKIAVEAKDNRRKMDSTQFEALMGKYLVEGGVKVSKVVIVTHNGFYEPVIERAKQLGVELLTLGEAKNVDWAKFYKASAPFKTFPRICDIDVCPPITNVAMEQVLQEGQVYCSHGTAFGNVQQFAAFLMRENVFRNQQEVLRQLDDAAATAPEGKKGKVVSQLRDGVRQSPTGQAWLNIEWKIDDKKVIRFRGTDYPVSSIAVGVHAISAKSPVVSKCYELLTSDGEGQLLSHLEATAGGKRFQIVIPHNEGGRPEKIVLRIDDAEKKRDSDSSKRDEPK